MSASRHQDTNLGVEVERVRLELQKISQKVRQYEAGLGGMSMVKEIANTS